jgi:phosphate transport system protein
MMRSRFDRQLNLLNDALIQMGIRAGVAILDAGKALMEQDKALAERVIASDDEIDQMEKDIERMCLEVILKQSPVAGDLRLVSSVLKMTTDLERIGDHASDISGIVVSSLSGKPYVKDLEHIPQMVKATMKMINDSIEAFVKRDEELARSVMAYDHEVNRLFYTVKSELIDIINAGTNQGNQVVDLLMVAKYLERIGDHATNIAEWVIFTLTGKHKESRII